MDLCRTSATKHSFFIVLHPFIHVYSNAFPKRCVLMKNCLPQEKGPRPHFCVCSVFPVHTKMLESAMCYEKTPQLSLAHCLILYGGGLGMSPCIMEITTQNPCIQTEHTELYKILKFRVNWTNIEQDTVIQKLQTLQRNAWISGHVSGNPYICQ